MVAKKSQFVKMLSLTQLTFLDKNKPPDIEIVKMYLLPGANKSFICGMIPTEY